MTISSIPTLRPAARALLGQAVLFDCDGVLVDSDPSVVTAWSRWATEFGLVPAEVVAVVHGRRSVDTLAALLAADRHTEALALINRYEMRTPAPFAPFPVPTSCCAACPPGPGPFVTSALSGLARARISASGLPFPHASHHCRPGDAG
jgi:sugar-phosphatase